MFWSADCGETAVITLGRITGCFCAWSSSANVFWIRVRTRSTPTIHRCDDTTILNFITFLVMSTHSRVVISLYKPSAQGVKVTASVALILTSTWWYIVKQLDRCWMLIKKLHFTCAKLKFNISHLLNKVYSLRFTMLARLRDSNVSEIINLNILLFLLSCCKFKL